MTGMRTLNRRLLRWRRYAARTCWNPRVSRPRCWGPDSVLPPGMVRAWNAQRTARQRRDDRAYDPFPGGQCVCAGCIGVGPCEYEPEYSNECCLAGDLSHPGPCVTQCSDCGGDGKCPDCGGLDDLGCHECGGSGSCPGCWSESELVDDWYMSNDRTVVTIDTGGLT